MAKRRFRVVYFIPNPFLAWEMPWCFEIEISGTRRRIRSGLSFTAQSTGSERRAMLANYCWDEYARTGNINSLGPNFRRRNWVPLPANLKNEDVNDWLRRMVHCA